MRVPSSLIYKKCNISSISLIVGPQQAAKRSQRTLFFSISKHGERKKEKKIDSMSLIRRVFRLRIKISSRRLGYPSKTPFLAAFQR